MKKLTSGTLVVLSLLLGFSMTTTVLASGPIAVSPGGASGFVGAGSACPTFSWSAAAGASGYELVVYATLEAAVDRPNLEGDPALRTEVPAGALSWTPSSESCLQLGSSYAWTVRALGDGDGGEWSEPALFRVEIGPVVDQVGGALERALARYLGEKDGVVENPGALAALIVEELTPRSEPQPAADPAPERLVPYLGRMVRASEVQPNDPVLSLDDWEIDAVETGSGSADYAQIVMSTPGAEPDWSWAVRGDNGVMFLNGPAFFDSIDFFTDGSTLIDTLSIVQNLDVGDEVEIGDLTVASVATSLCADASGTSLIGRCTSSTRYKDAVDELSLGLETVLKLHPVTFRWRGDGLRDLGFIAEEVAAVDPLLATYDEEGLESGVKYRRMAAVLTRAIQELTQRLDEQRREIERLDRLVAGQTGK